MTTINPPNPAAAANMASRLRKKLAAGKSITSDQQAFLDSRARSMRTPRAPAPRAPAPAPAPVPHYDAAPAPPAVDVGVEPQTVVDFGLPRDAIVVREPEAPRVCTIAGCDHTPHSGAPVPRCGITGEKYYGELRPNSRRAAANVGFAVIGFFIALAKGTEAPDPTENEVEDLGEAIKDIVKRRAPQLAEYDDLLAGGYAVSAYSIRAANAPKTVPK